MCTSAESASQSSESIELGAGDESRFQPRKLSGLPQAADETAPSALNAGFPSVQSIRVIRATCHAVASRLAEALREGWSAKADPRLKIFIFPETLPIVFLCSGVMNTNEQPEMSSPWRAVASRLAVVPRLRDEGWLAKAAKREIKEGQNTKAG